MSKLNSRRAHAEALLARERAGSTTRRVFTLRVLAASIVAGAVLFGAVLTSVGQMRQASEYAIADLAAHALRATPFDPAITITWRGRAERTGVKEWASFQPLRDDAVTVGALAGLGGIMGLLLSGMCLWLGADHRRRKQDELLADRIIAGTRIVSETELAHMTVAGSSAYSLRFGSVALPYGLETRHIAMAGTTGAGKTTVLLQALDAIEARGDAALVYDTSGEFIAQYYDPARGDVILNPFDRRGAFWNPFDEISHPADADRIARHLISETGDHDRDVWLETARILVANILRTLWREGRCTLQALLDTLQSMSSAELERWLSHTSSARTFAEDADKATGSVLFMLAKAVNLLMFLRANPRDGEASFSFVRFFAEIDRQEGGKPLIFVPRKESYFEAMKPLMALWLECAASAVLGLTPSSSRRLFFVLDELPDLPRVANMVRLLPEGRKFGASVILTFQTIGQMRDRYGREGAEALLGCCNTKLFLQLVDQVSREWASDTIGSTEVEISTLADTLDPKTGKPQQTLSTTRQMRPAVLESELRLPRHMAYLLLPDGLPVARIDLTDAHIRARGEAQQLPYIPADISETLWSTTQPDPDKDGEFPAPPSGPGPV